MQMSDWYTMILKGLDVEINCSWAEKVQEVLFCSSTKSLETGRWASYVKLGAMHLICTHYIYFSVSASVSKSTHLPGRVNTRPPPALLLIVILLQLFNVVDQATVQLNWWWKRRHEKMRICYAVTGMNKEAEWVIKWFYRNRPIKDM